MKPPHLYQTDAKKFYLQRTYVEGERGGGLFADPGMGKTRMALMMLRGLYDLGESERTLIVAPKRVIYSVWPDEIHKWNTNFGYHILHGSGKYRRLRQDVDIHLINPEGFLWLQDAGYLPAWDTIIVDESTFFKTWMSQRSKALRRLIKDLGIAKRLIMTGFPAENSLVDMHAQMYLVDDGESLGKTKGVFQAKYCRRSGFRDYSQEIIPERKKFLYRAIRDRTYRLDEKDHLDLPPVVHNRVMVRMPSDARRLYKKLEDELFIELANGAELTATGAGGKYSMCRGIANGGVYENETNMFTGKRERVATHKIHMAKVEACEEIVEGLNGKGCLIAYHFNHDRERLQERFPKASVLSGHTSGKEGDQIIKRWNKKQIQTLLFHPQTLAYGVNLQYGGNDLIWFNIPDRPGHYLQGNKRLPRQGGTGTVRIHNLITEDTVDLPVMERISYKGNEQKKLLDYLNDYRKGKR